RAGAVLEEVAVRQFRGAVAEVVDVEMGVELDDERVRTERVVDRQRAEVVAGDPEQKLAAIERGPRGLLTRLTPALVIFEAVEGEFLDADLAGVGASAGRHLFAAV